MKTALITGVTGQDGSYLADHLLDNDYVVYGIKRRSSSINTERVDHLFNNPNFRMIYGDLTDGSSLTRIIDDVQPDELYNLGAQSHVQVSFETPEYTANSDAIGPLRILEAIRNLGYERVTRYYQASTSEMYGLIQEVPQTESTPFYPRSPYGVAKLYGHWITKNYREAYDMFACSGILFNHESPRRGETFVTRKITRGLAAISKGEIEKIELGNLNALRDWGHAKDFVRAMHMMLDADEPDDYVIATGEEHSVREFVESCAPYFGMNIEWQGEGLYEVGVDTVTNNIVVSVNSRYLRPAEVDRLLGDSSKARRELGWTPEYTFNDLVEEMCLNELRKDG